jgi:Fur family zinc uptake transcriptional regulator
MPRSRPASANTERVLLVLRAAGAPMTAYAVLKSIRSDRPWAPPTAYRALNRLVEEGRAHRIESINAYIACSHDRHVGAAAVIAICSSCGRVDELPDHRLVEELKNSAKASRFQIEQAVVELTGCCARCATRQFPNRAPAHDHEPSDGVQPTQLRQASRAPAAQS